MPKSDNEEQKSFLRPLAKFHDSVLVQGPISFEDITVQLGEDVNILTDHLTNIQMELFGCKAEKEVKDQKESCPHGWMAGPHRCYKAIKHDKKINFNESLDECQTLGGNLAGPKDESIDMILSELLKDKELKETHYWIGIRYAENSLLSNQHVWEYLDGVPIIDNQNYNNWASRYFS